MQELIFKSIKMKDINIKYQKLDEFNELYGWGVYKNNFRDYMLYDLQCGEVVNYYDNLEDLIIRISSRALDYYYDEYEWDDEGMHISDFNYMSQLIILNQMYNGYNDWLKDKVEWLKNMKVYGKGGN